MSYGLYIDGIGILSPAACSVAELLDLARDRESGAADAKQSHHAPASALAHPCASAVDFSQKVRFDVGVPAVKVRRAPRYVKMTVAAASLAWRDGDLPEEERESTGTIFLTSFGSVESNISFIETVLDGVPYLVSPTQFSYTVPNSCLGQACIAHGFRGPSTMLLGGDPLEYSALLMAEKKAGHILCGAVEEWNEDLRASMGAAGQIRGETAVDGAVMLLLSAEKSERTYCRAAAFASAGLPLCPYVDTFSAQEQEESICSMTEALRELGPETCGFVLTAGNDSFFDSLEDTALSAAFGADVPRLATKRFFGEAFAAGYLENVALGAVLLKNERPGGIRSVVATGTDVQGNYLAVRLEA